MSNKKGLGGKSLEFTRVVPKFLENLKKQNEVSIDEKFKDYLNQEDNEEEELDSIQKDAIDKALAEEKRLKEIENEREQEINEAFEKEKIKRLLEDQEEEKKALNEGIERPLLFKDPKTNVTTQSSAPTALVKKQSSKELKKTTEDIKKSFQKSPKDEMVGKSKKPVKSFKKAATSSLSFDIDE